MLRSLDQLTLTKAELERSRQEYALDGAHLQAVAAIIRSGAPGPFAWSLSTDFGWMQITAEPEVDKLTLSAAAALPATTLAQFGVAAPATLAAALARPDVASGATAVGDLDPAPLWRTCGPSLTSPLGQEAQFAYVSRQAPQDGGTPAWHIGEAWRITATTDAGWRDDRIVRFTGDARHPAAVVTRRLSRGGLQICDGLLAALPSA
ncbi:hypothetical protein [Phenylobacterium sp.]|uniref:hypothetical protein n=1 Tax=Phenylobacterium sp. TaxID=1871053 RepID=UPI002D02703A|nr:hypothetical protein [Phenylobacterium sp.]HLZ77177.1 hypothetical protein [Phenylobacterium sp.]